MPGGRPPALNATRQTAILNAIKTGATERRSAAFAGVSLEAVRQWRRKGEVALRKRAGLRNPTERLYAEFVLSLDAALAETAIRMQAVVTAVAVRGVTDTVDVEILDPQTGEHVRTERRPREIPVDQQRVSLDAAKWWLSHRERDDYTTRTEVTGRDGGAVELSAPDAWGALLELAGRDEEGDESEEGDEDEAAEIEVR